MFEGWGVSVDGSYFGILLNGVIEKWLGWGYQRGNKCSLIPPRKLFAPWGWRNLAESESKAKLTANRPGFTTNRPGIVSGLIADHWDHLGRPRQ